MGKQLVFHPHRLNFSVGKKKLYHSQIVSLCLSAVINIAHGAGSKQNHT